MIHKETRAPRTRNFQPQSTESPLYFPNSLYFTSVDAEALRARACDNVAAVALAAKNARIIWAMLARGTEYQVAA